MKKYTAIYKCKYCGLKIHGDLPEGFPGDSRSETQAAYSWLLRPPEPHVLHPCHENMDQHIISNKRIYGWAELVAVMIGED